MDLKTDKAALVKIVIHVDDGISVKIRLYLRAAADDAHLVPTLLIKGRLCRVETRLGRKIGIEPNLPVYVAASFLVVDTPRRGAVRCNLGLM